jgi:hypothetical protein
MEYQDDQPSNHPAEGAYYYREQVDRYVIFEKEVGQEEEYHPDYPVDEKPRQRTRTPPQQNQDHQYHYHDKYDRLHKAPPFRNL